MPTKYQAVRIPFQGTSLDQSPFVGDPRITATENCRFTQVGKVIRRPGFLGNANRQYYDTSTAPPSLHPFLGANWGTCRGTEAVVASSTHLYSYVPEIDTYYDRGILTPSRCRFLAGASLRVDGNIPSTGAAATSDGKALLVSDRGTTSADFYYYRAGGILDSETLTNCESPRVMFYQGLPMVVYKTGGNVKTTVWDQIGFDSPVTTTLATDFDTVGANNLDAYMDQASSTLYVIYRNTTANTAKILKCTTPTAVSATQTFTTASSPANFGITASSTKVVVGAVFGTSLTTKVYNTSLVDQAVNITTANVGAVQPGLQMDATSANCWVTFQDSTSAISGTIARKRSVTAATDALVRSNLPPFISSPWGSNGRIYCLYALAASGTNTASALAVDITDAGSTNHVVARVPNVRTKSSNQHVYSDCIPVNRFVTFDSTGGTQIQSQMFQLSYPMPQTAQHGRILYIAGSCPSYYDGAQVAEQNFHVPGGIDSVGTTGAGTVPAGSYTFQAVYRWVNAAGEIERSVASLPVSFTAGGAGNVRVTLRNLAVTQKSNVYIELYRTIVNPTANSPFYLETTLLSDPQTAQQTFDVALTDAQLQTKETLYANGPVLDSEPVTANGGVVSHDGRLWFLDDEKIWISHRNVFPDTPWFSTFTAVDCPTSMGKSAAMGELSDRVVAWFELGAVTTGGPGLDQTGAGSGYYAPARIFTGNGPRAPQGVTRIQGVGLAFESSGQIFLMDLGGNSRVISGGIRETLTNGHLYVLNVFQDKDELCVMDATDFSSMRLLNYRVQEWSYWTVAGGQAHAFQCNGLIYILTGNGGARDNLWLEQPGTLTDFDSAVESIFNQTITTSWVRPDQTATAWNRVRSAILVADNTNNDNSATISVTSHFDDNDANAAPTVNTIVLDPNVNSGAWPSSGGRIEIRFSRQKCNSIRLVFAIGGAGGLVENFPLSFAELQVIPAAAVTPNNLRRA